MKMMKSSKLPFILLQQLFVLNSSTRALSPQPYRIAIIGGGSSGILAASSIQEGMHADQSLQSSIDITIFESTPDTLRFLRDHHADGILYDTSKKPMDILKAGFPRGRKEIMSMLTKYFPPLEQQNWFENRGVTFTTRLDGTMTENDESITVAEAIMNDDLCEMIQTKSKISSIFKDDEGNFHVTATDNSTQFYHCIILATGNSHSGYQLAKSLGHTISKPVRSCFGLVLTEDAPILSNLQEGIVYNLPFVRLSYKMIIQGQKRPRILKSEGSAQLQMHNDQVMLTGIASLSLSSLAAFEFKDVKYQGSILVHFCPDHYGGKVENIEEFLWQYRQEHSNEFVEDKCPLSHQSINYNEYDWETDSFQTFDTECIPRDLWRGLLQDCGGVGYGWTWSKLSPKKCRKLAEAMVGTSLEFSGRSVTWGGYPFLSEIDMASMESKIVGGLFCCGQVLDGDGSHGSFSLMRSFAMGKMAGESALSYARQKIDSMMNNVS